MAIDIATKRQINILVVNDTAAADLFKDIDVLVCPTNSNQLVMTNLTGHPAIILPHGFRPADTPEPQRPTDQGGAGTPLSITFLGDLFGEAKICAFAKAFQDVTDFHLKHPNMDAAKS